MVWVVSLGAWTFVAIFGAVTISQFYRSMGTPVSFLEILGMQFSQTLTYVPLTPLVFALATRYPIGRENLMPRSLLYFGGGLAFSLAHVALRGMTSYAFFDSKTHAWYSAIWDSQAHALRVHWQVFKDLYFRNVADDVTGTYAPIVLVAHLLAYYRRNSERERRTSLLEAQLSKAKMQTLKAQIQPHFLFNTLHSISALMLTNVTAADRMMTRLSELLRMSLKNADGQITMLSRELEFVSVYLEIERMRFGERLNVKLDIANETLDAQVPHLLLQPLVENAVRHGIGRLSVGPGEVRITSQQAGNSLILSIADNGPGIVAPDKVELNGGVGLRTTKERLKTLYGSEQSFGIATRPEGGAEVSIRIPFHIMHSDT
jgi:signal transduction histidine kinase